jgi:hypothetical protein
VLEVVATFAGVLLAASHLFDEAPRFLVVGFLAATYVLWALGMRANLIANCRLLEETGTSTNALSKVGFDLARLRSSSQRAVRAASAAGYVVTEIAKEAAYYAGVFGTALLSDSVDSTDALVFLGGANLGAAVYEYGVARLTRAVLNGRSRRIARHSPPSAARHELRKLVTERPPQFSRRPGVDDRWHADPNHDGCERDREHSINEEAHPLERSSLALAWIARSSFGHDRRAFAAANSGRGDDQVLPGGHGTPAGTRWIRSAVRAMASQRQQVSVGSRGSRWTARRWGRTTRPPTSWSGAMRMPMSPEPVADSTMATTPGTRRRSTSLASCTRTLSPTRRAFHSSLSMAVS